MHSTISANQKIDHSTIISVNECKQKKAPDDNHMGSIKERAGNDKLLILSFKLAP